VGSPRDNDVHLEPDKLGRDLGEALALSIRPAIFDRDSAALDPAELAQSLRECHRPLAFAQRGALTQKPDGRQPRRLLRARHHRPRNRRAADERDELAPLHSITSSAMASSEGGTVVASTISSFHSRPTPRHLGDMQEPVFH
jgi:hypothetical protein